MKSDCRVLDMTRVELRPQWLDRTAREFQLAAGISGKSPACARAHILAHTAAIPAPDSPTERVVLRGFCVEFGCRVGLSFHGRFHHEPSMSCRWDTERYVMDATEIRIADPLNGLRAWTVRFFEEFERAHPSSSADQIAEMMLAHHDRPWTLVTLAAAADVDPQSMARDFRDHYGISPRAFLETVRLVRSLQMLGDQKIEVVARATGYRSPKSFYQTFRRITGSTPAAIRSLSSSQIADLAEALTVRLLKKPKR